MTAKRSWVSRIGWMAAIWCLSVVALAAVSYLLRLLMNAAGMTAP